MDISPVRIPELGSAFALLYGPGADAHTAHAFRLVARGELNPDDLLVARTEAGVCGAVFCQRLPGSIAALWPPRATHEDTGVEDALMTAALEHVAGAKVVQAFLPAAEADRADVLLRAGFQRVTRVWEMYREPTPCSLTTVPLTLQPYPEADPTTFQRVLMRSHEASLDCPELSGIRTPDDVLAGYRDCAPDSATWWLAHQGGDPVGVLILSGREVTFIGVIPECRRRGIGRAIMKTAIAYSPELSLIVDERNEPAIRMYRSLGFTVVGAREVYLRSLS